VTEADGGQILRSLRSQERRAQQQDEDEQGGSGGARGAGSRTPALEPAARGGCEGR
jgi:hypothetical protein